MSNASTPDQSDRDRPTRRQVATGVTVGSRMEVDSKELTLPTKQLFNRRRVMVLIGRSVLGAAGAGALVNTIVRGTVSASAPTAVTDASAACTSGTFDATMRMLYRMYTNGNWGRLQALFDPNIVLFVPPHGFPNPGTYQGPAAVLGYWRGIRANGWRVVPDSVSGLKNFSIGVHHGISPAGADCASVLMCRFTAAGLVQEQSLFGFS